MSNKTLPNPADVLPAIQTRRVARRTTRRKLLAKAGLAAGAVAGAGLFGRTTRRASAALPLTYGARGSRFRVTDADILNFALNLEYLEAEFYQRAAFGTPLTGGDASGAGTQGTVDGGSIVAFQDPVIQQYANEIAVDELNHVRFLRNALGTAAVARPQIDLNGAFTAAARAAGVVAPDGMFNPFTANGAISADYSFLLGAFIFEDVGVTAYQGGAPYIRDGATVGAAASILAVEAQHAAEVRTTLYARAFADPTNLGGLITAANQIAAARASLSQAGDGVVGTDQGPAFAGNGTDEPFTANICPANPNGQTFARSFAAVLNIVYLGGYSPLTQSGAGGFFPNGMNGRIR